MQKKVLEADKEKIQPKQKVRKVVSEEIEAPQ